MCAPTALQGLLMGRMQSTPVREQGGGLAPIAFFFFPSSSSSPWQCWPPLTAASGSFRGWSNTSPGGAPSSPITDMAATVGWGAKGRLWMTPTGECRGAKLSCRLICLEIHARGGERERERVSIGTLALQRHRNQISRALKQNKTNK